jgi:diacylglycerol O-acyltransferase
MARTPLSAADTFWLRNEDPTNLMMVTAVMMFGRRIDPARLRRIIEERLLPLPRFRERVDVWPLGLVPQWVTEPNFDLDAHLHHVAVPEPGDKAALEAFVGDLSSTPLDFSKPLWQWHLIDYGEGSVIVARVHHAVGDGMALVRVLLSLTDTEPNRTASASTAMPRDAQLDEGYGVLGDLFRTGNAVAGRALGAARRPGRTLGLLGQWAAAAATGLAAIAEVALMLPDPRTSLKGPLGFTKRVAWSEPIDLALIKAIGARESATVNDVLVSAAAGGLRRYLKGRGDDVAGLEVRAAVPVNLRPPEQAYKLGNQFGLVMAPLPVGIADPRRRLVEVKRQMDDLKSSMMPVAAFGLLNAVGLTHARIQDPLMQFFGAKSSLVLTNVPGPTQPLYLAGRRLDRIMFWVPQSGRLALGVSILSYAGEVLVGVTSDAGLVPDPAQIVAGFEAELARLGEGSRRRAAASRAAASRRKASSGRRGSRNTAGGAADSGG